MILQSQDHVRCGPLVRPAVLFALITYFTRLMRGLPQHVRLTGRRGQSLGHLQLGWSHDRDVVEVPHEDTNVLGLEPGIDEDTTRGYPEPGPGLVVWGRELRPHFGVPYCRT